MAWFFSRENRTRRSFPDAFQLLSGLAVTLVSEREWTGAEFEVLWANIRPEFLLELQNAIASGSAPKVEFVEGGNHFCIYNVPSVDSGVSQNSESSSSSVRWWGRIKVTPLFHNSP